MSPSTVVFTTSYQELTDLRLSLPCGRYLIFGTFWLWSNNNGPILYVQLRVNGVPQNGLAQCEIGRGDYLTHNGTFAQNWLVESNSDIDLRVYVKKDTSTGFCFIAGECSKLIVVKI
ncbi:MAG: hypothetical protein WC374_01080 [Phycisphaerae bacterium]